MKNGKTINSLFLEVQQLFEDNELTVAEVGCLLRLLNSRLGLFNELLSMTTKYTFKLPGKEEPPEQSPSGQNQNGLGDSEHISL